jgi:hypothetical protein
MVTKRRAASSFVSYEISQLLNSVLYPDHTLFTLATKSCGYPNDAFDNRQKTIPSNSSSAAEKVLHVNAEDQAIL